MYRKKAVEKYLDDLAAKLPAPGGGSAAAASAAMGVALISMVINFTLGKAKYAAFQQELAGVLSEAERIRNRLSELVDLDVEAFSSKDMQKALGVPVEIARLCVQAIEFCPALAEKGNRNLISDVAVAAILLEAGFSSALFNININLKYLGDVQKSREIRQELSEKKEYVAKIRKSSEERANAVIRG